MSKKRFVLRMDMDTMKALEKWAAEEFRSVNGQIEFLLTKCLREYKKTGKRKADKK